MTEIVRPLVPLIFHSFSFFAASSHIYLSSLWIRPAVSSVSMKSPGISMLPSGRTHLTSASAPVTVPSPLKRGWRYILNCPPRRASSKLPSTVCSRRTFSRISSLKYATTWVISSRIVRSAEFALPHMTDTGMDGSSIS